MLSADIPHLLEVLLTAMACGALIGAEREWTRHDAGLRTNTLVSLGAAVYGFLSMHAFGGSTTDPSRIAAQVVTGIGFIGAGVILQRRRRVMGLTTAATLWVAAGVGLAAGGGQFTLAWTSAIFVLLVQVVLRALESAFNAYRRRIRDLQLRYLLIVKTPDKVDRNLERIVLDAISRGDVRLVRAVAAELPDKHHEIRLIVQVRTLRAIRELEAHLALVGYDEVRLERVADMPAHPDDTLALDADLDEPWDQT